jgi:hypothetical protein
VHEAKAIRPTSRFGSPDLQVMDFTDQTLRNEIDAQGPMAIQVHSGTRWIEKGSVSYRNIRVKDLTVPCNEPDPGTVGSGGAAAATAWARQDL